jgi:hypothetical protein
VLAQKAGMPRHAFLDFLNKSVMGSMFTRYKTPALVNLDFHVTFTPKLLRKDLDLGLDAGREFEVPMPLTSLTRDLLQQMIGHGMTEQDFSTLLLMQAKASGIELKPENVQSGRRTELMYTATANVVLPTTIIGSLPRPSWYTQNLGRREFREAMVDRAYREQYLDAVLDYHARPGGRGTRHRDRRRLPLRRGCRRAQLVLVRAAAHGAAFAALPSDRRAARRASRTSRAHPARLCSRRA